MFSKLNGLLDSFTKMSSFMRLVLGGIFLPIMLPWILYRMIQTWHLLSKKQEKLQNRVVLITGASSGLGEAMAHLFYRCGCKVILAARRIEELERVKKDLLASEKPEDVPSHVPEVLSLDLADLNSIPDKVNEALSFFGTIDILINNGGISYRGKVTDTSLDVDLKVMVVNYFGQVAMTKAVLPTMLQNNYGHIVAISSIQGRIAIPFRSAYAASKHAFQAFFDTLRSELYSTNIKVTVINPGYLKTNLSINAITGSGSSYGVIDATTAKGLEPSFAAKAIQQAIVLEKEELLLSSLAPQLAVYLRILFPKAYFLLMKRRAHQPPITSGNGQQTH